MSKSTRVSISGLSDAIMKELEEYGAGVELIVEKAAERTAADAERDLGSSSPRRTGKYASGWRWKNTGKNGKTKVRVCNERPGLPHLLENGHALKNGGRTREISHIAPVNEQAQKRFEELVRKELEK